MQFFSGSFIAYQKIYYKNLKDTVIAFLSDTVQKRQEIEFAKLDALCVFMLIYLRAFVPSPLTHLRALNALIMRLAYVPSNVITSPTESSFKMLKKKIYQYLLSILVINIISIWLKKYYDLKYKAL